MNSTTSFLEANHFDLYHDPTIKKTTCDANDITKYLHEYFHHYHTAKKICNFSRSFISKTLIFSGNIQHGKVFAEIKHCYATFCEDAGEISTLFQIRLKLDAKMQTQRPTRVPTQCRERLNALLDDLQTFGTGKQIGSTRHDKLNYGKTFLNPFIIFEKNGSIKIVFNTRHFNSNTDHLNFDRWNS